MTAIKYQTAKVDGSNIFYREAGPAGAPKLLLLHGFPTSSHMLTGLRIALKHPERITAIISQNGNAYEEGLSDGWNPFRAYWQDASQKNREFFF